MIHRLHLFVAAVLLCALPACSDEADSLFGSDPDGLDATEVVCDDETTVAAVTADLLPGRYAITSEVVCGENGCDENIGFVFSAVALELTADGGAAGAFLRDSLATWRLEAPAGEEVPAKLVFDNAVYPAEATEEYTVQAAGQCFLQVRQGATTTTLSRLVVE